MPPKNGQKYNNKKSCETEFASESVLKNGNKERKF